MKPCYELRCLVMRPAWIWTVRRLRAIAVQRPGDEGRVNRRESSPLLIPIEIYCLVKLSLTELQIFVRNVAPVFTDLLTSSFTLKTHAEPV